MTKSLNTSHALYSNLTSFICVDAGALTDLKVARTFTVDAAASFVTGGTYGDAFHTTNSGGLTPRGASMSPGVAIDSYSTGTTIIAVVNSIGAGTSLTGFYSNPTYNYTPSLMVEGGFAEIKDSYNGNGAGSMSTVTVQSNGAHCLILTRPAGDVQTMDLYVDGALTTASKVSTNGSTVAGFSVIGGAQDLGSLTFDLVYLMVFNKVLTSTEKSDIYASLGVNTVSLLTAPVTTPSATIGYTEANDTTSITSNVAGATAGTITTGAFKNNTGSVLASLTALTVTVLNASTLAFVKAFASQTTNGSGIMTLTDALLVAGTQYAVVTTNASGTLGVEKYTAA